MGALIPAEHLADTAAELVRRDDLLAALEVLSAAPVDRGAERGCAEALAAWSRQRWPQLGFTVQDTGAGGANLAASTGSDRGGVLLCSHLDTSTSGEGTVHREVTGSTTPYQPGVCLDGDAVSGFGLGVARAPAAAVLVGYAAAATALAEAGVAGTVQLLLASGGTHRNTALAEPPQPACSGVRHYLDHGGAPDAVIVGKSGPPGVLHEEPGAAFLRIRVSAPGPGVVLFRDQAQPVGGLPQHVGLVCAAFEAWRGQWRALPTTGQTGREAGIGAIRTGAVAKPDLLPAHLDLFVYLVSAPGDELGAHLDRLHNTLVGHLRGSPLAGCTVEVTVGDAEPGGATPASAPIVELVRAARARHLQRGGEPDITGWTGSTDGVLFRARGIDTVRAGPQVRADPDRPGRDVCSAEELVRYAQVYAAAAVRFAVNRGE
ncbi:hypothetical protein [Rhodococcus sp. X156]|uniref:hypothetical protein n=1 Tax=Rhodococcus sp. X156 TaxID=2499145 RepID=UPI000FD809CA|nr:hypothetical protein [Rhodococcus sp. X156]